MEDPVIRIPPYHYVHVLDLNSNVTHVEVGPHTYIRQDHERWVPWGGGAPAGTYIPRKEVEVAETLQATVIGHNQAIRLRARKECLNRYGTRRVTGEEWLVKQVGAYLPGVYEEVMDIEDAYILTDKKALHLRATRTFEDEQGRVRRTGEEWLVTQAQSEAYIPDVFEEVVAEVAVTTLGPRQYCVVLDPVGPNGQPQLGQQHVVKRFLCFAFSAAVESAGAARAEAQARAEAARIEGEAAILQAKLKAEAIAIETEAKVSRLERVHAQEVRAQRARGEAEAARAQALADVEASQVREVAAAPGPDTIRDIARAGPELQVKLLQGLGLQSTLITDGTAPLNLFTTARGLLGLASPPESSAPQAPTL
ncbi:major vault protein [Chlamydotis macqueenii]